MMMRRERQAKRGKPPMNSLSRKVAIGAGSSYWRLPPTVAKGEPIGWTDTSFIAPPDACKGGARRRHVVNAGVVGNQGRRQGE